MFILHTDGGSRGNPGPSAIGAILFNEDGIEVARASERIEDTTNNVAEYLGLLRGIKLAQQNDAKELAVHMDSELIIKQLQGEYKVKAVNLQPLYHEVQAQLHTFSKVTFTHVPREHPRQIIADMLVNWALDT
jgi:ribonuclease HI